MPIPNHAPFSSKMASNGPNSGCSASCGRRAPNLPKTWGEKTIAAERRIVTLEAAHIGLTVFVPTTSAACQAAPRAPLCLAYYVQIKRTVNRMVPTRGA